MPISNLNNFGLPYASTCHAVQGMSIDYEITVFDVDVPHVDLNFIWVAITRARDLSRVNIMATSDTDKKMLTDSRIKRYFEEKTEGYKKKIN